MPATIPYPVQLRVDFRETVNDAISYSQLLEHVICIKGKASSEVFHGKVDHSQPPWNAAAANHVLDLHALSRQNERFLRTMLNFPVRIRGGSSGNTRLALEHCVKLAEGSTDTNVKWIKQDFDRWVTQAKVILGQTETAKRLPREHGKKEAVCPWCKRDTLRQLALEGLIKCVDPKCTDEEGRRPFARLEYFHGEPILRWQDGIIGVP
jgi:hypothetical protein